MSRTIFTKQPWFWRDFARGAAAVAIAVIGVMVSVSVASRSLPGTECLVVIHESFRDHATTLTGELRYNERWMPVCEVVPLPQRKEFLTKKGKRNGSRARTL